MTPVLLALVLWVPGALLHRALGVGRRGGGWGTGALALEAALSLGFLALVLLPFYVARSPVAWLPVAAFAATAVLAAAALRARRGRGALATNGRAMQEVTGASHEDPSREPAPAARAWLARALDGATPLEVATFVVALVLLVPTALAHSGATVDDWWDLSFVSGWLAEGRLGWSQMALSPDPVTQSSPVHPRFLWSVWLVLQALVAEAAGRAAWKVQAGPLAAVTIALVVSAQAALARSLAPERAGARAAGFAALAIAATTGWIWATEPLPLFVRGYQDKFVAGFVLAPVLVALVLRSARACVRGAREEGATDVLALAFVAIAAVSVHSLVYSMALFAGATAVAAVLGIRGVTPWVRRRAGILLALGLPALYPLAQAAVLAVVFDEQGVSLATPGNPVVRAHLSLDRLVGASGPAWIVHPGAVFAPVALVAAAGVVLAWRRRRDDDAARVLVALALAPCALLFVPGLAALAGKLWLPWMLYRIGWMVPVAPLVAFAVWTLAREARAAARAPLAATVLAVVFAALAIDAAADRVRRGLDEHPGQPDGAPVAAAAAVFEFLAAGEGRDAVLAPPNFSELVPALAGKPVVAFPERGTLVFAGDDRRAYERLRDRATFFSAASSREDRDGVAERYGARWAVLPRRQVASASERWWLWRFGPEALLAARAADEAACGAACGNWWSASRAGVAERLSASWSIVLETRDYFVVERGSRGRGDATARGHESRDAAATWLEAFEVDAPAPRPVHDDVLATATGSPGSVLTFDLPPRFLVPEVLPVWADGPGAWEDAPAEARLTLELGATCEVSAIEVVPHLPRARRDVLELAAGAGRVRSEARHNEGIVVPLDAAQRDRVGLEVRSLLGNPVSLADVRVLGDASSCSEGWPRHRSARAPGLVAGEAALLDLVAGHPPGGRALSALARRVAARAPGEGAGARDVDQARLELLTEAVRREPSLVEAWIELGFVHDAAAAAAASADDARARLALARRAFEGAVRADSNSGWARGCLAWVEQRSGRPLRAIVQAVYAAQLDPNYADAWTVLAYALGDVGLGSLAERALAMAEHIDPARNWPALARADLALGRREPAAARAALDDWLARHPYDRAVRAKLADVEAAEARQP